MAASYIPAQDSALDNWSQNFANLITASPGTYGLLPTDATTIQGVVDDYHAAYLLAGLTAPPNPTPVNPATRTPVTVADKDAKKNAMKVVARVYASQIRLNPGVSNMDKIALGLNLPNTTPSPIPAPTSFPLLTFLQAAPLTHQFSYKDSDTAVGKSKAPGAIQGELRCTVSATPLVDPDALAAKQAVTKSPFLVEFTSDDVGKVAYYAMRWVTRTGLFGPWSTINSHLVIG